MLWQPSKYGQTVFQFFDKNGSPYVVLDSNLLFALE